MIEIYFFLIALGPMLFCLFVFRFNSALQLQTVNKSGRTHRKFVCEVRFQATSSAFGHTARLKPEGTIFGQENGGIIFKRTTCTLIRWKWVLIMTCLVGEKNSCLRTSWHLLKLFRVYRSQRCCGDSLPTVRSCTSPHWLHILDQAINHWNMIISTSISATRNT